MGLAAAAGLALIGVVAIALSGEKHEPVALAVSATQSSTRPQTQLFFVHHILFLWPWAAGVQRAAPEQASRRDF